MLSCNVNKIAKGLKHVGTTYKVTFKFQNPLPLVVSRDSVVGLATV
jgi:hypothetical protein